MAAAIVNSAEFVKENIEPTLERGFLDATSLAEYLVTKGVPFRTAHQIVGTLVRKCEEANRHKLAQLSVDEMNDALKAHGSAVGLTDDVYNALARAQRREALPERRRRGGKAVRRAARRVEAAVGTVTFITSKYFRTAVEFAPNARDVGARANRGFHFEAVE